MEYSELLSGNNYLLIVAHPDDELYCCVLLRRLVQAGKSVHIIFITSGDAGTFPEIREKEAKESTKHIGIKEENLYFLRVPELSFPKVVKEAIRQSIEIAKSNAIDYILGQDYEGGHEGHDLASYCASAVRKAADIKSQAVYPVYHGKPHERKGARFKPTRKDFITIPLTADEKKLKSDVLTAHKGQKSHFDGLQNASGDYMDLLLSREVFLVLDDHIDYTQKPLEEVGYESHRNGFTFKDFKEAISASALYSFLEAI